MKAHIFLFLKALIYQHLHDVRKIFFKRRCENPRKLTWYMKGLLQSETPILKKKGVLMFNLKALPLIERKPDGSPPRMTPGQRKTAVRLIRKLCSNYDDGNCILLDNGEACVCVQSISYSVNCKFFRHVLLEDKEGQALKAEIFRGATIKRCAICGRAFQSKSNSAKYCKCCAPAVHRRQKAISARKRRSDVDK